MLVLLWYVALVAGLVAPGGEVGEWPVLVPAAPRPLPHPTPLLQLLPHLLDFAVR